MDKEKVLDILKQVSLDEKTNLLDAEVVKNINIKNNVINLDISISNPSLQFKNKIKRAIEVAVSKIYTNTSVTINFLVDKGQFLTT